MLLTLVPLSLLCRRRRRRRRRRRHRRHRRRRAAAAAAVVVVVIFVPGLQLLQTATKKYREIRNEVNSVRAPFFGSFFPFAASLRRTHPDDAPARLRASARFHFFPPRGRSRRWSIFCVRAPKLLLWSLPPSCAI